MDNEKTKTQENEEAAADVARRVWEEMGEAISELEITEEAAALAAKLERDYAPSMLAALDQMPRDEAERFLALHLAVLVDVGCRESVERYERETAKSSGCFVAVVDGKGEVNFVAARPALEEFARIAAGDDTAAAARAEEMAREVRARLEQAEAELDSLRSDLKREKGGGLAH